MNKLNYTEMFHSIQGEGSSIGRNVVFLRLNRCNLHCSFCDSKHSWSNGKDISFQEIYDYFVSVKAQGICITGGEPTLQQDLISKMLNEYDFKYVEIETNGTIQPIKSLIDIVDKWNVSPKLSNSENNSWDMYKPDALKMFNALPNAIFKFVVSNNKSFNEINDIIKNVSIFKNKVYIMCEGETRDKQNKNQETVIDLCLRNGYNYSPRLHILIWDNKQKV